MVYSWMNVWMDVGLEIVVVARDPPRCSITFHHHFDSHGSFIIIVVRIQLAIAIDR